MRKEPAGAVPRAPSGDLLQLKLRRYPPLLFTGSQLFRLFVSPALSFSAFTFHSTHHATSLHSPNEECRLVFVMRLFRVACASGILFLSPTTRSQGQDRTRSPGKDPADQREESYAAPAGVWQGDAGGVSELDRHLTIDQLK